MIRVAVHLHVFYPRLWPELAECVRNIASQPQLSLSLFVTYAEAKPEIFDLARADFPDADIQSVPNRGYDVGPFMDLLHRLDLREYDYVVKLHSKRDVPGMYINFRPLGKVSWRSRLLEFCRTKKNAAKTFRLLENHPDIGMACGSRLITNEDGVGKVFVPAAADLMRKMGFSHWRPEFVAGTMFIARVELLRPLQRLSLRISDFPEIVVAHRTGELPHAFETVFSWIVSAQNQRLQEALLPYWLGRFLGRCRPLMLHAMRWFKNLIYGRKA